MSDLPEVAEVSKISVPALLLAWETDGAHPLSTTEQLSASLRNSSVVIATRVEEIHTWPARAAEFFRAHP